MLVDDTINEGWNYYEWETSAEYPKYRYYRFSSTGNKANSCAINEIKLHGVEAMDDESATYECTAKLVINEQEQSTFDATVTYDEAYTPELDAISPRYGTVEGGD